MGNCCFGEFKLISIALLLCTTHYSGLVLASNDGQAPSEGGSLSLTLPTPVAPKTQADEGGFGLESKIERIWNQVEVIRRGQEKLSRQIGDICQKSGEQTGGGGGELKRQLDVGLVEKDVFKFNRLASNLIPSSSLLVATYGHAPRPVASDSRSSVDPLIQRDLTGPPTADNAPISGPPEWPSVKEQLAGLRLSLNKLMSRVLEQSHQYETIWSQLALIKDECSLAYQSTLRNGLSTAQVSNNGGSVDDGVGEEAGKEGQYKQKGEHSLQPTAASVGLRSSDISTLVRLISEELSNVCPLARVDTEQHHLHHDDPTLGKEIPWLTRQLAEINSVTKQTVQILNRLSDTVERKPVHTLVLDSSMEDTATRPANASASGQQVNSSQTRQTTVHAAGGRTSSRWQPGSKVPQNCRSSTDLEVAHGCEELKRAGATCSGKYLVYVLGEWRQLYCDMTERDPWTVVMRRIDKSRWQDQSSGGSKEIETSSVTTASNSASLQLRARLRGQQESFNVDLANYERGFGAVDEWAEFFGGLALMHKLTSGGGGGELQVELEWSEGRRQRLGCGHFRVANASLHYQVSVSNCSSRDESAASSLIAALVEGMNGAPFQVGNSEKCRWGWWRLEGARPSLDGARSELHWEPTAPLPLLWPSHSSKEPLHRLQLKVKARSERVDYLK